MLQAGKISSVELTSHFLQRIDQNPELNAFITVDAEAALNSAREADTSLNGKGSTLLTGLPIALKDIFCTRGMLTSCGSRMLANFISPYDATVTERLKAVEQSLLAKRIWMSLPWARRTSHRISGRCLIPGTPTVCLAAVRVVPQRLSVHAFALQRWVRTPAGLSVSPLHSAA